MLPIFKAVNAGTYTREVTVPAGPTTCPVPLLTPLTIARSHVHKTGAYQITANEIAGQHRAHRIVLQLQKGPVVLDTDALRDSEPGSMTMCEVGWSQPEKLRFSRDCELNTCTLPGSSTSLLTVRVEKDLLVVDEKQTAYRAAQCD